MSAYSDYTDKQLVELFSRGDERAFEAIYYRYARHLYRYARKNIDRNEDCEEMVHDVFESLLARRDSLMIGSLKHYLFTSIRYMIIRYFSHRDVKRRYERHFLAFEAEYSSIRSEENTGSEAIHRKLLEIISDLPERCQEAIRLRISENLSNREIAERMNITKRTAEVYISRAFHHLRESYDRIYGT